MAMGRERSRFETSLIVLAAYHFSKSGFRENPALNVTKLPALWIYQRVKCPSLSTKITLLYSHIACKKWFRNGYPWLTKFLIQFEQVSMLKVLGLEISLQNQILDGDDLSWNQINHDQLYHEIFGYSVASFLPEFRQIFLTVKASYNRSILNLFPGGEVYMHVIKLWNETSILL